MWILKFLHIARPICISYLFVIIHMGVDNHTWTRRVQFTHVYNQATHVCTWNTHMWHSWHACCVELVGDLYHIKNSRSPSTCVHITTVGHLFWGLQFCKWLKRKLFSPIYISVFFSVCNLCHDRIFANFQWPQFHRSPQIHSRKFVALEKRYPMV